MGEKYQRIFQRANTDARITSPQLNILFFEMLADDDIEEIMVNVKQASSMTGQWYFNVRLNGVPQFAGSNRMLIPNPAGGRVTKTGLSIPAVKGDLLQLDLEQTGSGGELIGPVIWTVKQAGGDSGGAENLTELDDVNIEAPADNEVLTYDSGEWVNAPASSGALSGLTDVDVTGVSEGDVLTYDASESEWIAVAPSGGSSVPSPIGIACSDETTDLTTGDGKATFRMPFTGTLSEVRATLTTASSSGAVTVDVRKNGTTVFSTPLTVDASEKTSTTAATPAVVSVPTFADDDEFIVDIDGAGTGAKGLKLWFVFA